MKLAQRAFMADDQLEKILERLERLERRIEQLEGTQPTGTVLPPPVIRTPVKRSLEALTRQSVGGIKPQPQHLKPRPKEPEQEPAAKTQKEDGEFVFGSKVLPRAGIVIVLLAMLYLVALGIKDEWITPQMQFGGELLLCAGLIGVGIWKLNEREDFGQVLVGGGACGLYFSLAGAYAYKELVTGEPLITGERLVVLFALLSLVVLGFSWWRSSKTFWVIGYVGGLVAAGLPMDRSDYTASLVLAAIIVAAATSLAAHRKWFKAIAGLWLISSVFVMVVVQIALSKGAMDVAAAIALFYAFSFVPIGGYALSLVSNKFDEKGWFLLVAGGLTALATFTLGDVLPAPHSVSVAVWSLALLALAYPVRKGIQMRTLAFAALVSATVIAPLGFTAFAASMTYAALGLAVSAVSRLRQEGLGQAGPALSACYVALTIVAYAIAMGSPPVSTTTELVMLGAIAVGVTNVAYTAGRLETKMATAMTIGAVVFFAILSRATYVSSADEPVYVMLVSQSIYAVVLSVVGLRAKWQGLSVVAMVLTAISVLTYYIHSGLVGAYEPGRMIAMFAVMTVALILSALGTGRNLHEQRTGSLVAAALGCFVVVPMLNQSFGLLSLGFDDGRAMVFALTTYAITLGLISHWTKWPGQAYVGAAVTFGAVAYYWLAILEAPITLSPGLQIALTLSMCAALAACAFGAGGKERERQAPWVVASVLGWFALARTLYLLLVLPAVGMAEQGAVTTSWTLYAALVLTAGFLFDMKYLRITSLVMFGVTIAKVFLVDLAELEDLVKVLVLLVLGLVILGGGYLYVRARNAREDAS